MPPGVVAAQLQNPEYHNWLKVGLAIQITTDGLRPFFEARAQAWYATLICDWKTAPAARGDPEWTVSDLPFIKTTGDGTAAGTEYKSSQASKQRQDFAAAIKQNHTNPAATNKQISYEHCDASQWGEPDAWFEPMKAYVQMRLGSHESCIKKRAPADLDICGITAAMQFCVGFSGCIDQRRQVGVLEAARNVRNTKWGHIETLTLDNSQTTAAIQTLRDCLQDDTGGNSTLLQDPTVSTHPTLSAD
jgi:hypothetical protein